MFLNTAGIIICSAQSQKKYRNFNVKEVTRISLEKRKNCKGFNRNLFKTEDGVLIYDCKVSKKDCTFQFNLK